MVGGVRTKHHDMMRKTNVGGRDYAKWERNKEMEEWDGVLFYWGMVGGGFGDGGFILGFGMGISIVCCAFGLFGFGWGVSYCTVRHFLTENSNTIAEQKWKYPKKKPKTETNTNTKTILNQTHTKNKTANHTYTK